MDYYIYKNDQNVGPLPENEVADGLRSGRFTSDDLGCRVGEESWVDLDFFFPNISNQAHSWMDPSNSAQSRIANPQLRSALGSLNNAPQWPVSRPVSQPLQMSPPISQQIVYQQPTYVVQPIIMGSRKSRVGFILLGIFLGVLGIHNFYAGYAGRGIAQLLLTILLSWTIIVPFVVWVWVIIEIIAVDRDAFGNRFS